MKRWLGVALIFMALAAVIPSASGLPIGAGVGSASACEGLTQQPIYWAVEGPIAFWYMVTVNGAELIEGRGGLFLEASQITTSEANIGDEICISVVSDDALLPVVVELATVCIEVCIKGL